jgi:hypothetical protein
MNGREHCNLLRYGASILLDCKVSLIFARIHPGQGGQQFLDSIRVPTVFTTRRFRGHEIEQLREHLVPIPWSSETHSSDCEDELA